MEAKVYQAHHGQLLTDRPPPKVNERGRLRRGVPRLGRARAAAAAAAAA